MPTVSIVYVVSDELPMYTRYIYFIGYFVHV